MRVCRRGTGHSLWGVWVEIPDDYTSSYADMCHSLWGVWVEIGGHAAVDAGDGRHSLWGVWVEIVSFQCLHNFGFVTPFGECGLKFTYA